MSNRANALIGFGVAGVLVTFLAQYQPKLAVGLVGLVGLGVLLNHTSEVGQLVSVFQTAAHPF